MALTWFRVAAVLEGLCLSVVLGAAGCGGESSNSGIVQNAGAGCTLASDCRDPLICTAGRCHAQCAQSRDCDFGQRCVKIGTNTICQLQAEAKCDYNSDCTSPLVCAVDRQCRVQCQSERDCTKGQVCTPTSKVCAEPAELNAGKELQLVTPPALDGGPSGPSTDASPLQPRDAPQTGASDVPLSADAPLTAGPVDDFNAAWKVALASDAGVTGSIDGGVFTALVVAGQAPSASASASDPPRILVLSGQIIATSLRMSITYEANTPIASTLVMPYKATYFTRVVSPQPKTPSHPNRFDLALALPQNLAQLTADGLAVQVQVALEDSAGRTSNFVTVDLKFQRLDGGGAATATATTGKVCSWDQPATCLPDGTGMLVCAVDESSVQVVDCQAGPPAYRCTNGPDGGVVSCVCPNLCATESKSCGRDSCGHDCGTCPAGSDCDPLGNCHPRDTSGCADGTREAFTDTLRYPSIAGCEAWWEGAQNMRNPRSGQGWCGNSTGIKCNAPADACAPGWHVCMQSGWPADIRDRPTYPHGGLDAGSQKMAWNECRDANNGHWFASASSSAYPADESGSCSAFPLGCYGKDVAGFIDTVACGNATTTGGGCANALWSGYTIGIGPPCATVSANRTDQNGVLCCRDPEITGS